MNRANATTPYIAIACGGTGGHLFPGLAVGEQLVKRGCAVALLVSPKEVDQQAVKSAKGMEVITLPAVALQRGSRLAFVRGFWQSWRAARKIFKARPPHAVLAMGGFTSAPPILAARSVGARTFLHESNTIPGRANRWLARFVDEAFVGFPEAVARLKSRKVTVTGTPVRVEFSAPAATDTSAKPLILVMGGSQGASGINEMILSALPLIAKRAPHWQWLHLTGASDFEKMKQAYGAAGVKADVHPFLTEMNSAMAAATATISRAGASSLAEIAAMRLASVLVPYPFAADDHQLHNGRAFEKTGAARVLEQKSATPERLVELLVELVENADAREKMQNALSQWHAPNAAEQIAETVLRAAAERAGLTHETQSPRKESKAQAVFPERTNRRGTVAQIFNLLYRRIAFGRTLVPKSGLNRRELCGLQIRDTAEFDSALRPSQPVGAASYGNCTPIQPLLFE